MSFFNLAILEGCGGGVRSAISERRQYFFAQWVIPDYAFSGYSSRRRGVLRSGRLPAFCPPRDNNFAEPSARCGGSTLKKICFLGTGLWSARLAELVNRHGSGAVKAIPVRLRICSFLRRFPSLLRADVLVRVGFRPGVGSLRGIVFDFLWLLIVLLNSGAQRVYYWIGTDVLRTLEDQTKRPWWIRQYFFECAKNQNQHFAAAPWLARELSDAGISAKSVLFPSPLNCPVTPPDFPPDFSVLSYIPDKRYNFYGGKTLLQVARNLPEITFHVVAGEGAWAEDPPANLQFHGWLSDMTSMYMRTSVVVRLVPHDALGGTVREGLAFGRYVIYSFRLPHVMQVPCDDVAALQKELMGLFDLHRAGELPPNVAGMEFAKKNFDERKLTQELIEELVYS